MLMLPIRTKTFFGILVTLVVLAAGCRTTKVDDPISSSSGDGGAMAAADARGIENVAPPVASPTGLDLNSPIPSDPAVKIGKLDNGLTYYIRKNVKPANRAELRLAVNAGSILESDAQVGLAHFVEHMAFNGTERFKKQELIEYLESTGVRFGADLNAYTSFDETVYMLQVPTDSVALLDTGIQILREWSSRILFEADEVEKERGVVIEEWRLGRGAGSRIRDKELPITLHGSRYPDRLPIGTLENLQTFDPQLLTEFYRDWYRPDLMAVVVVGDFDVDHVESLIRSEFASLTAPINSRVRATFEVPGHAETLVSIVADPEAPVKSIAVMYKADDPHANEAIHSVEMFREQFVEGLYTSMLNDRLSELTQNEEPPFFGAGSGFGRFARSKKLYNISAIPGAKGYAAALESVLTEVERVKAYGFEPSELDRAKEDQLRRYERAYLERDKSDSRGYASEYVNNFLENEPIPGIEFEFEAAKLLLPGISIEEVNGVAGRTMTDEDRVLLVSGPEVENEPLPTEDELLPLFTAVKEMQLSRYVDAVEAGELLEVLPETGRIVSETYDESVDVHHLTLSNGVEVYYKQTDFKNDQILMSATSPGGTSLVADDQDVPGDFASTLVLQSGVGRFGPIELQKKLSGKVVQVIPSITERRESISGVSSPADLETLLQLTYLYFTAPRADSVAYKSLITRYRSVLENMGADPQRVFFDTLSTTLTQNHPRRRPLAVSTLEEMNLQQSFEIYQNRFADASDFKFFFVGTFDPVVLRSMVETYIGSLPSLGRDEEPRDLGIRPPSGHVEKIVKRGTEPKSQVQLVWTGDAQYSEVNRRTMKLIEGILDIQLREVLREDMGGTYGVSVSGSISAEPVEEFRMSLGFGSSPDRIQELVVSALMELDRFQRDGPDQSDLDKVLEKISRQHEVGLKQNEYWISSIQYLIEKELPLNDILTGGDSFYKSVTPEDLRKASLQYLDRSNLVKVILNPVD